MKKLINFAKAKVIEFECFIAIFLNKAFPAIVSPAIIAAINEGMRIERKVAPLSMAIFATILAPAAPDNIPHTSPTTSFKTELTLSAFLTRDIACLLPLTFLAAIALKSSIVAEATARPIISVNIARAINTKMTIIAIKIADPFKTNSLSKLNDKERDMARIRTIKGHIQEFLFLDLDFFSFIIYRMLYA